MLKSIDYDIDPDLLAAEVNKMMPSVIKDLKSIEDKMAAEKKEFSVEDKMAYGKEELLKYLEQNERLKALAFIDCFEGNTGETLKIKDIVNNRKSHNLNNIKNDSTPFPQYNIDDLLYKNDPYNNLSEVSDTLLGFIKIYHLDN